ncbi:MAG: hypothetical protein GY746_18715 [Gammaproteobacteria bacterium]|nr:hypothetical protein [Gammaproteobacteria bacterium]
MGNKKKIANDHPIREIWELNKLDQLELAKRGDRQALKSIFAQFRYQAKKSEEKWGSGYLITEGWYKFPPTVIEFLKDCFGEIIVNHTSPNDAFQWTDGTRGGRKLDPSKKMERARMGYEVACLMNEGESLEDAAAIVAEKCSVSESTTEKAYKTYMAI